MKKKTATVFTAMLSGAVGIGLFALSSCSDGAEAPAVSDKFASFSSEEEIYGYSAASAATVISAMEGAEGSAALPGGGSVSLSQRGLSASSAVTDGETIDRLNSYMLLAEGLLSDGAYVISTRETDSSDGEAYSGYGFRTDVTCPSLSDDGTVYTMYYSETVTKSETKEDSEDGESESKTETSIDGVLVIGGADYPMEGNSESAEETDGDGQESEYEQELSVRLGDDSRLKVKLETESETDGGESEGKTEYSYSLYEGGSLSERTKLKYETDGDGTEIKMTQYLAETGETAIFYLGRETEDGEEQIKIRVGSKDSSETYTVTVGSDGNYVYTLKDGTAYRRAR